MMGLNSEQCHSPSQVVPKEQIMVNADPDSVNLWHEPHMGRHTRGYSSLSCMSSNMARHVLL